RADAADAGQLGRGQPVAGPVRGGQRGVEHVAPGGHGARRLVPGRAAGRRHGPHRAGGVPARLDDDAGPGRGHLAGLRRGGPDARPGAGGAGGGPGRGRRSLTARSPCAMVRCVSMPGGAVARNLLLDYFDVLPDVIARSVSDPAPDLSPASFSPGFALPELDAGVRRFLAPATAEWRPLAVHAGSELVLLDLMRNPATSTTKTLASLLIVARAIEFIRRTGQPVIIFTPTSANKGTALRDAVDRALQEGLAGPDQLRIVMLAPESGLGK